MDAEDIKLNEESLVYYKNIEFLKEITKQATALMGRSNSIYHNILDEPKHKMTVQSASTASVTLPPDPTVCTTCGESHKVDFCILQEIVNEEKNRKNDEFRLKNPSVPSVLLSASLEKTSEMVSNELPLFAKGLSSEELKSYRELISARYGNTAGDRFLLARSLLFPKDEDLDKAIVGKSSIKSKPHLKAAQAEKSDVECGTKASILKPTLCPESSSTTREKMSKTLELRPPCVSVKPSVKRNRKLMFERSRFLREHEHKEVEPEKVVVESSEQGEAEVCPCNRSDCTCRPGEICVEPPSKKACCKLIENTAVNNHLMLLRQAKQKQHQNYEQMDLDTVAESIVKDSVDLNALRNRMYEDQINSLGECLEQCLGENINQEEAHDIRNGLQLIIPNKEQPDEDQWQRWNDQYKLRKIEESIKADSLDGSTILTHDSRHSMMSEDELVDVNEKSKLHPTRIPYANEVFHLTNDRFDKIIKKFHEIILTALSAEDRISLWPKLSRLVQKMLLRRSKDPISREILQLFNSPVIDTKIFVPRHAKQWLDTVKRKKLMRGVNREISLRERCEQIQLGLEPKVVNPLEKYTAKRNYVGFTPYQRQLLKKPESVRFKTCDLIGDDQGRTITKAVIQRDYLFLKILMDTSPENMRKHLFDSGLEERYLKFRKTLEPADNIAAVEAISVQDVLSKRKKEESILLGSANKMNNYSMSCKRDFSSDHSRRLQRGHDTAKKNPKALSSIGSNSSLSRKLSNVMLEFDTSSTSSKNNGGKKEMSMIEKNYGHVARKRSPIKRHAFQTAALPTPIQMKGTKSEMSQTQSDAKTDTSAMKPDVKSERRISGASHGVRRIGGGSKIYENQLKSESVSKLLQTDFDTTVSEFLRRNSAASKRQSTLTKNIDKMQTNIFAYPITEDVHRKQDDLMNRATIIQQLNATQAPAILKQQSDSPEDPEPAGGQGNVTILEPASSDTNPPSLQFLSPKERNPSLRQSEAPVQNNARLSKNRDLASRESRVTQGEISIATPQKIAQIEARRQLIDEKVRKLRGPTANSGAYQEDVLTGESTRPVPWAVPSGYSGSESKLKESQPSATYRRTESKAEMPVRANKPQLPAPSSSHSKILFNLDSSVPLWPDKAPATTTRDTTFAGASSSKSVSLSKEYRNDSVDKPKLKDRRPTKFQRGVQSESSQSVLSSTPKVSQGLPVSRSFSQLFPGKKIVFGLDVGQGLRNVKFVKDNALGADDTKKQEMVKLLTGVKEKRVAKQPSLSSEQSLNKSSASISVTYSQQQYSSRNSEPVKSERAPFEYQVDADSPTQQQRQRIKTLDEIYKEAHGINKNNTPSILVEHSYEFESHRKQQLKKHRQER